MGKIFDRRTLLPNLRVIATPLIMLVTSVSLLIVVFINFYPKVKSMFSNFDDSKKRNTVLEERIRVLKDFKVDANSQTDVSSVALPIENPGTLILSNIKNLSNQYQVEIVDVSFQSSGNSNKKNKWQSMELTLETRSLDVTSFLNFLSDVVKTTPIVSVDEVSLANDDGFANSSSLISIYWSDPPETIPSLNSPIKSLSEKENETLSLVQSLRFFEVSKLQPGSVDEVRLNPFN